MFDSETFHHTNILLVFVIKVICHVAAVTVLNISRSFAEVVPDAGATSVFIGSPLDLVSGRGHTPSKVFRKIAHSAGGEVVLLVIDGCSHFRYHEISLSNE